MKKSLALAAILAGLITVTLPAPAARADVHVSFSFFQDSLSPYGRWVSVGSYGRCWYPVGVPVGWQPYTVGHWGYGDYGWTWASADPWGDVTYRYGTWTFQPPYGWVWVPGYVWAPAWVTWSYTNDYIGWAPIPPSFAFSVGGYFGSPVVVSRSSYCFVPRQRFAAVNVVNVRVPVRDNHVYLARGHHVTRFGVSDGVVHNSGIELRDVERVAETRVRRISSSQMRVAPARIEESQASGRRIAVAAPASARPATRNAQVEKASRVEREREPRGPSARQKKEPAPQPERDVRKAPESRPPGSRERAVPRVSQSEAPSRGEVSRPSQTQPKRARASASSASRSSKPSTDTRVRASSGPEKSRAVQASAPRPPASREVKSSKSSGERPKAASKPSRPPKVDPRQ